MVEFTNLQRQVLFDESDAGDGLPKAIAASNRLAKINCEVKIEPVVADVDAENIEQLARECDLLLDGTDNIETRYLINDVAAKNSIPWIYGGCVGTEGRIMTIVPGSTACLRCVFPEPPAPAELQTCDTAGVLGPVAGVVASLQAADAIKLLSGNADAVARQMLAIDLWNNRIRTIDLSDAQRPDCTTCGLRQFPFLQSKLRDSIVRLCGRNSVQVRRSNFSDAVFSLDALADRLHNAGRLTRSAFLVRCELPENLTITVFADGLRHRAGHERSWPGEVCLRAVYRGVKVMPLIISNQLVREIERASVDAYPRECCGILLGVDEGKSRHIRQVIRTTNASMAEDQHHRFAINPAELIAADQAASSEGLLIVGFYHSHPDQPARPSEFDRSRAWPFYSYLIVSVLRGKL